MNSKTVPIAILISIILFVILSTIPIKSIWGFNHLVFLNDTITYIVYLILGLSVVTLFVKLPDKTIQSSVSAINKHLFGVNKKYKVIVSLLFGVLFYIFKSENYLLGDGYALIGNLGQGQYYIHKWAEVGSIYLIRAIQQLLGGHTKETALIVFQLLSISSGILFVYNVFGIVSKLTEDIKWRLFGCGTLLFSGYMLLFFGYVEYYPITLALISTYISFSLSNLQNNKYLSIATLFWILAFASHVLSIIFLPGLLYLFYNKIKSKQIIIIFKIIVLMIIPIGIYLYYWLYNNSLSFEILNLPILNGRPVAPNYTVFSIEHLRDLFNLVFLVLPGCLVLLFLSFKIKLTHFRTNTAYFLLFSSIGSISFLILFGAAITMGRDWDIMSLTLFFPILLVIYLISKTNSLNNYKHVFGYLIFILAISSSFISVSIANEPAEKRFYSLLNSHNRNMWMVFGQYYVEKGEKEKFVQIGKESLEVYPDYIQYKIAYKRLEQNDNESAFKIATKLYESNPYEPDFLQLMAFMYYKYNELDKAEDLYVRALQLKPYSVVVRNDLSQVYLKQKRNNDAIAILDEAREFTSDHSQLLESLAKIYISNNDYNTAGFIADTLIMYNSKSASHLINMTIMIQTGKQQEAIKYYKLFKHDGTDRADYQRIVEHYEKFLKE